MSSYAQSIFIYVNFLLLSFVSIPTFLVTQFQFRYFCYQFQFRHFLLLRFCRSQTFCAVNFRDQAIILIHLFNMPCKNNFNQTFILWFKSASIGFGDQTISLHKFRPLFLYSSYNHLGKFEEFLKIYFEIHEELNPFLVWVLIIFLILIIMLARSISWKHPSNSNFSEIYYNLVFFGNKRIEFLPQYFKFLYLCKTKLFDAK